MELNRRNFLRGLAGIIAAPAIVRPTALMPVKLWRPSIIANTYKTFSAIGVCEDLADYIYSISPTETPFIGRLTGTMYPNEWRSNNIVTVFRGASAGA